MHTNGRYRWYVRDLVRNMKKQYRSQHDALKDFTKWNEEEPGRYEMLSFDEVSLTFVTEMTI